ncbi:MAG: TatD DNase family protein [Chlamydiales bacterium]|jgi:TatD DNase family protein
MFIDSHAHITTPELAEDLEDILLRAKTANVSTIVNICTDVGTLKDGIILAEKYPWIYNTAATTPHDVEKEGEEVFPFIEEQARNGKLVAVGETGLDYYYTHSSQSIQKDFLKRYLHLALDCKLPVVIHCREAFADFFEILDAEYIINGSLAPGVLHCFTGTIEEARQVIERGWFLSLSGIVTFKKSHELREVAKIVPPDQLLIETDSPYLAPQSHRGKRNEPSYLPETAKVIAEVKGMSTEDLARVTSENAKRLFSI